MDNDYDSEAESFEEPTISPVAAKTSSSSSKSRDNGRKTSKSLIKNNLPLLEALTKVSEEERKCMIRCLGGDALNIVCCCVFNALFNRDVVPRDIRKSIKRKLKKENDLESWYYIAKQTNNAGKRRKLLAQRGAGLPLMLSGVLPTISASVAKTIQAREKKQTQKKKKKNPVKKN